MNRWPNIVAKERNYCGLWTQAKRRISYRFRHSVCLMTVSVSKGENLAHTMFMRICRCQMMRYTLLGSVLGYESLTFQIPMLQMRSPTTYQHLIRKNKK